MNCPICLLFIANKFTYLTNILFQIIFVASTKKNKYICYICDPYICKWNLYHRISVHSKCFLSMKKQRAHCRLGLKYVCDKKQIIICRSFAVSALQCNYISLLIMCFVAQQIFSLYINALYIKVIYILFDDFEIYLNRSLL